MQRYGVFGASFNPPTIGHRDAINQALTHFDEILLVPSISHAFQKSLTPIHHRLAMLKIFTQFWEGKHNKVRVMNIEADIQKQQPTATYIYTFDVLCAVEKYYGLHQPAGSYELSFIMGPDIAEPQVWQKFHQYQEIDKRWSRFIVKELIPIHSTTVKEAIQMYQHSTKLESELEKLVGKGIAQYILEHRLYQEIQGAEKHV